MYVRDNTLMAQPFDGSSGQLQGEAAALTNDLQIDGSVWRGTFSASDNGTQFISQAWRVRETASLGLIAAGNIQGISERQIRSQ